MELLGGILGLALIVLLVIFAVAGLAKWLFPYDSLDPCQYDDLCRCDDE